MLSKLIKFFNNKPTDLSSLIKNGAAIVDVRSKGEFVTGHVQDSINIPLEEIPKSIEKLKAYHHIIVCCRSGIRSGQAQRVLKSKGFKNVTNGGGWQNVNKYI